MSKAFTKDDDSPEPVLIPPRAPLPEGMPNYVTPRGLAMLHAELAALEAEKAEIEAGTPDPAQRRWAVASIAARTAMVLERIGIAMVVEPAAEPPEAARFGLTVTVRADGEERRYRIVGVDEADPAAGDIAFTSPIARALLGKEPGDEAIVQAPRGEQAMEIVSIAQD